MAQYGFAGPFAGDPFAALEQLRRGMDEIFERTGGRAPRRGGAFPPVNLYETADAYVLTAELPGVRGEDVELSLESNRVTLRGERRVEHPAGASAHRVERASGSFQRTVELPADVDADKAEASCRHGVLMLRIPKAPQHQRRRITVSGS